MTDGHVTLADVVNSASDVLRDIENGVLRADEVEARVVAEMRRQFGQVNGPGDALWELHLDMCRQVLEAGGLSGDELAEWTAVARRREGLPDA